MDFIFIYFLNQTTIIEMSGTQCLIVKTG